MLTTALSSTEGVQATHASLQTTMIHKHPFELSVGLKAEVYGHWIKDDEGNNKNECKG